jgi:hypothetical protein
MDDRKHRTSPASHCAGPGSESVPIAADAQPSGRCQVDAYCFHGDELSQGLAAVLRIMGFDPHGLRGGIAPGNEQGSASPRNTDVIDPQ